MAEPISPRIWGRVWPDKVHDPENFTWQVVTPTADGVADRVYITNLCQVLLLSLGESPFFANYGIPAQRSVIQQIFPDYYVNVTQQQFSQYFASLQITKVPSNEPFYRVNIVTHQGAQVAVDVPL